MERHGGEGDVWKEVRGALERPYAVRVLRLRLSLRLGCLLLLLEQRVEAG